MVGKKCIFGFPMKNRVGLQKKFWKKIFSKFFDNFFVHTFSIPSSENPYFPSFFFRENTFSFIPPPSKTIRDIRDLRDFTWFPEGWKYVIKRENTWITYFVRDGKPCTQQHRSEGGAYKRWGLQKAAYRYKEFCYKRQSVINGILSIPHHLHFKGAP